MSPDSEASMGGFLPITQYQLMAIIWGGVVLSGFFTIVRYIIRLKYMKRLLVDDAFILLALMILVASAIMYQSVTPTMFLIYRIAHQQEAPPENFTELLTTYLKMQFAITILFWTSLWMVKFAFLAFFHKLGQRLRAQRLLWNVVLAFTVFAYVGCLISYPIACSSFAIGSCDGQLHVQRALISLRYSTAIDVISDTMIILLPLNLVWKIDKMKIKDKAALGIFFSLGVIIMVFAIIRVAKTNSKTKHPEPIWLAQWSAIESSIAIIVSSLACFKTIFTRSSEGHRSGSSYPTRQGHIPLMHHGQQHSVTVRGGFKSHPESLESSIYDEDVTQPQRVHVKTDVEVVRSQ